MSNDKIPFDKPARSPAELITLLESRGLKISDSQRAERYLRFISYYRLGGYFRSLQKDSENHTYHSWATFDIGLNLYIFDRKLRVLFLDAVDRIEIAFRTSMSNIMSKAHGPHWFIRKELYKKAAEYENFVDLIEKKTGLKDPSQRDPFCDHYFRKYSKPYLPPSWMVAEVITFGDCSRLYSSLKRSHQKAISKTFDIGPSHLGSWTHCMTNLRNICAHHKKLWDNRFPVRPKGHDSLKKLLQVNNMLYDQAVITKKMLNALVTRTEWPDRLSRLLETCPHPDGYHARMGFPQDWQELDFWKG